MSEDQKYIYYAGGEEIAKIDKLPQTEVIKNKGWEMIYLTDNIDEFAIQALREYEGKPFKSVNDDEELLGTEDKETADKDAQQFKDLLDFIKDALAGKIKEARVSRQLISQPVCLTAEGGLSFEMEKYLRSVRHDQSDEIMAQRVLQLNPAHEIFTKLEQSVKNDPDRAKKLCELLYGQACLIAGLPVDDPAAFSQLICSLVV